MLNFTDAQEMHKQYPDTFDAPSKKELSALKIDDIVKVSHGNERFWASITKIKGNKIKATVDNAVFCDQPFKLGDEIEFEKRHIYAIWAE